MADFWHFCNKIPLLQAQSFGVTVQRPHLTSPIEGEETFFPRPWWEGLGEGGELIKFRGRSSIG